MTVSEERMIHKPNVASKSRENIFIRSLSVSTGPLPCSICIHGIPQNFAQIHPRNEEKKNRVLVTTISGFSCFIFPRIFQKDFFQNFGKGKWGTNSKLSIGMIIWYLLARSSSWPIEDVSVVTFQNPALVHAFAHSSACVSSPHLWGGKYGTNWTILILFCIKIITIAYAFFDVYFCFPMEFFPCFLRIAIKFGHIPSTTRFERERKSMSDNFFCFFYYFEYTCTFAASEIEEFVWWYRHLL